MDITRRARRLVYVISAAVTFILHWPLDLPLAAAIGSDIGGTLWAWGIPALALWLGTRRKDATGLSPYIAPTLLWLIFFAAHVLQQVQG